MDTRRFILLCAASTLVACSSAGDDGQHTKADRYDASVEQCSRTARLLAARVSDSPLIDADLARRIDHALGPIGETLDRKFDGVQDVHLNEINVGLWNEAAGGRWAAGKTRSGDPYLDGLAGEYGLAQVEQLKSMPEWFTLTFNRSLNLDVLVELYRASPHVRAADPNGSWVGGCGGVDWGNMSILKKGDDVHLVFARGWGDCLAGCIHCEYTYFTLSRETVTLIEVVRRERKPRIYRWNVPDRFPATAFADLDDLLAHTKHDDWWARRHAVEAAGWLLTKTYPSCSEDHSETWERMQSAALARRLDVVHILVGATRDQDPDVAAAAQRVIEECSDLGDDERRASVPPPSPAHQSHR